MLDPPLYRERITEDLIERLKLNRRKPPDKDPIIYWHEIYNTFFPGASEARPVSPCEKLFRGIPYATLIAITDFEGPSAESANHFVQFFSAGRIGEMLPFVRGRLGLHDDLSPDVQATVYLEILQESLQLYLQHIMNAASRMPRLGHRASENHTNLTGIGDQDHIGPAAPQIGASELMLGVLPVWTRPRVNCLRDLPVETTAQGLPLFMGDQHPEQLPWLDDPDVDWVAELNAFEQNHGNVDFQNIEVFD